MTKDKNKRNVDFFNIPFEERGNSHIEVSDISPVLVLDYLYATKSQLAEDFYSIPFIELLNRMDLVTELDGKQLLKNVAAMMFCKDLTAFFPATQVNLVIYPGGLNNSSDEIQITKFIGTVPEMIKQTMDFIRTIIIIKQIIKPKDRAESITFFNYPYLAVNEALISAFIQRDYQKNEPIHVAVDSDKISIQYYYNPELFDVKLNADNGVCYNNSRLGAFLNELGLCDEKYYGISAIQNELKNNGSDKAQIMIDRHKGCFAIEIPKRTWNRNN